MNRFSLLCCFVLVSATFLASCSPQPRPESPELVVIAVEPFLADIARHVAGDRLTITTLIPGGVDPHSFELTPRDAAQMETAQVLIINGGGLEEWLEPLLSAMPADQRLIVASRGLVSRAVEPEDEHAETGDPHYWLNPNNVVEYVNNIRDGLTLADPAGAETYAFNAAAYTQELKVLDAWIHQQVSALPPERRMLVTNHESFGYYADQYGFTVVGAVLPSVGSGASPSARDMAALVDLIRSTGAQAIFLETGANPELAEQIAADAGIKVVTDLYTHSLSSANGPAPTYIDMMIHNTTIIVEALK